MTSYTGFVTGLAALDVDGVNENLTAPPTSLEGVHLPALWAQLPRSEDESPLTFEGQNWADAQADIVIAVNPPPQSTQEANFALCLTLMDALKEALEELNPTTVSRCRLTWTMRQTGVNVGGVDYWAVIATVKGKV